MLELRRVRHPPAHHGQLALAVVNADHRRDAVREDRGQGRQVARGVSRDLEQVPDRGLILGDRIEIAH
jgi:hypothetical protein